MDWKREAADMLRNYPAMLTSLSALPEELKRLEVEATALRSAVGGGEPVVGGHGDPDDRMISNIVRREGIKNNLEIARRHVAIVEMGLSVLDDEERLVLDRLLIHREQGNINRLCDDLRREKTSVYRRRDRALRHFTIALYGITES